MLGISTMCTAGPRTAPCKGLQAIFLEETPSKLKAWKLFSRHGQPLGLCNFYTWICAAQLHDSCICRQCSAVSHCTRGWFTLKEFGWPTPRRHRCCWLHLMRCQKILDRRLSRKSFWNRCRVVLYAASKTKVDCSGLWPWYTITINRSPIVAMMLFSYVHTPGIILLRFPSQDSSVWQCGRVVIESFNLSEKALRKPSLSHCSWVSRAQCLPYLLDCAKRASKEHSHL